MIIYQDSLRNHDLPKAIPASRPSILLWDWNGTLLDDLALCLRVINTMLTARELPQVSRETYLDVFDFPVKEYYLRLGFDFSREPFERISTEFITAYEQGRPDCPLMDGARAALTSAADLGIAQSILSASRLDYLLRAVREYHLADFFQKVLGLDNHHAAGKGQLAEEWLSRQKCRPDQVLMIGDTTHDAEIAGTLGIACILVPNGHHSRERLLGTGAPVFDSLHVVQAMIAHWKNGV